MRLVKHPSLLLAERVVRAMRPLLAPHDGKYMIHLNPYANGRERGLALVYGSNIVTIAEHRNSDDIRVWYSDNYRAFDHNFIPQDSGPAKDHAQYRCFRRDAIAEAAAFCAYYLLLNNGAK